MDDFWIWVFFRLQLAIPGKIWSWTSCKSKAVEFGTRSYWLHLLSIKHAFFMFFWGADHVMYLYLLCPPSIRSVNNGYIEFAQATMSYTHQTKSKNCFVPFKIYELKYLHWTRGSLWECRNGKLHEISFNEGLFIALVTNRFDFSTYHLAVNAHVNGLKRTKTFAFIAILKNIIKQKSHIFI